MPVNTCTDSDQIEDIEDILQGEGGQQDRLPRERFNNRTEVLLRPKKRRNISARTTLEDKYYDSEQVLMLFVSDLYRFNTDLEAKYL